jgi:flagellar assembly factor FliW
MTVNLQAPLVINPSKRIGKQVITVMPEYTTKHQVFLPLQNLMKRTG